MAGTCDLAFSRTDTLEQLMDAGSLDIYVQSANITYTKDNKTSLDAGFVFRRSKTVVVLDDKMGMAESEYFPVRIDVVCGSEWGRG